MLSKIESLVEVPGGDGPQGATATSPRALTPPLTPHPVKALFEASDDASSGTATPATLETNVSEGRSVERRREAGGEQRQAGGWWDRVREFFRRRRGEVTFQLLVLMTMVALSLTVTLACRAAQDLHDHQQQQQEVGAKRELKEALDQCLKHLRPWRSAFDILERGRRSLEGTPGAFEGNGDPYLWDDLEAIVQRVKQEEESRQVTNVTSTTTPDSTTQPLVEPDLPLSPNSLLVNDSLVSQEDLDWVNPDQDETSIDLTDLLHKLDTVYRKNHPKPSSKIAMITTLSLTTGMSIAFVIFLLLLCRWKQRTNLEDNPPAPSAPPAGESLLNLEYREPTFEEIPL